MPRSRGVTENLLHDGFDVRISTRGSSMFPLISTGDMITISHAKRYVPGDVIVFKRDDQMVCHRLVKVFERGDTLFFQTTGDSFFSLDEPITADQVLGKLIKIERVDVSLPRRILLLAYPVLRFGRLNARVVSALMKIRKHLRVTKSS